MQFILIYIGQINKLSLLLWLLYDIKILLIKMSGAPLYNGNDNAALFNGQQPQYTDPNQ